VLSEKPLSMFGSHALLPEPPRAASGGRFEAD
jgi:hypothetical protein